jgi:hypothetical protein
MVMSTKVNICWNMTLYTLMEVTDVSEEPADCIFSPGNEGHASPLNVSESVADRKASHSLVFSLYVD